MCLIRVQYAGNTPARSVCWALLYTNRIQIDILFPCTTAHRSCIFWSLGLISWQNVFFQPFQNDPKWIIVYIYISKNAELHAVPPKAMMGMWRRIIRWHHHVDVTVPLATLAKGWEAWIRCIWMRLMGLLRDVPGPKTSSLPHEPQKETSIPTIPFQVLWLVSGRVTVTWWKRDVFCVGLSPSHRRCQLWQDPARSEPNFAVPCLVQHRGAEGNSVIVCNAGCRPRRLYVDILYRNMWYIQ